MPRRAQLPVDRTKPKHDGLAEMILDLNARLEQLEGDRRVTNHLLRSLADAAGYELETSEVDGGIEAKWVGKSRLVRV